MYANYGTLPPPNMTNADTFHICHPPNNPSSKIPKDAEKPPLHHPPSTNTDHSLATPKPTCNFYSS